MNPARYLNPVRFGRRGAFLLLFGLMWSVSGYSRMTNPPLRTQLRGIEVLLEIAPFRTWAALWFVTGLLALVSAFFRKPGWDVYGFVGLSIPVTLYGVSNAAMYFVAGYEAGLQGATVFACMLIALVVVAGWPEPRNPKE